MNNTHSPSGLQFLHGDVLYRCADIKGTRLYARVPTLALAIQQYEEAVRKATTNPRCPYTMVWIMGDEGDHTWIKDDKP